MRSAASLENTDAAAEVTPDMLFRIWEGIFDMLHVEIASKYNPDTSDKTWSVWLHCYTFGFYLQLINSCMQPFKFLKQLQKRCAFFKAFGYYCTFQCLTLVTLEVFPLRVLECPPYWEYQCQEIRKYSGDMMLIRSSMVIRQPYQNSVGKHTTDIRTCYW